MIAIRVNTGMFRVELLCVDFVMFDVCARYARASTLPHREVYALSMYKRDTYREYILLSSRREKDTKREIDISHFRKYSSVFSGSDVQHRISEK